MKTGWKVVLIIVTAALLLGAVSIGVGFMTGGSPERIIPAIDDAMESEFGFNLQFILDNYRDIYAQIYGIFYTI